MVDQKFFGWARNVFMAVLLVGGVSLSRSAVLAADVTSTEPVVSSTPVLISAPAPVLPHLTIPEQGFVGVIGEAMQAELHVSGGVAPYRWSLVSSGLPEGVFFDASTGRLLGAPGRTGQFNFTVQVMDSLDLSLTKTLSLKVGLAGDVLTAEPINRNAPISIDLEHITENELKFLVDTFADDAPLIYVGPNAPVSVLKVNIAQMRITPNGLYRVEGGTVSTVNETHKYSDVYYVDPNGRRHAFPTESVFKSWYKDAPVIEAVPDWKISNIPLRQNVTFRPGTTVRLENTQEFYQVSAHRTLKKFQDEATYQRLAPSALQTSLTPAPEVVPVLPLVQVGDYMMDVNTIKGATDLLMSGTLPMYPVEEMGDAE
jgi:hypothetical protein